MNENFEGYGEKYFFLPQLQGEEVASLRLPKELKAKDVKSALAESKKYGHGIVTIQIAEV